MFESDPPGRPQLDPLDCAIGSRLRQLRAQRKLAQKDLGDALDVSFQQIQKYERGTNRIPASSLVRLAKLLGVSLTAFFEGDGFEGSAPPEDPTERELLEAYQAIGSAEHRRMAIRIVQDLGRTLCKSGSAGHA